jgi:hypothetical protein
VNKQHLKDARTKRGKPAVQKVYAAALKQLQDDYYDAVGKPCGLMRVGPGLARQSTKEYAADRQQAKRMADEAAKLDEQRADQDVKDAGLKGRAGKLQTAEAALAAREVAHQADVTAKSEALVNERTAWESTKAENQKANDKREKTLAEKENELQHRETELTEAVEAMTEVFAEVETGDAEIVDGKCSMSFWPDLLNLMRGPERESVSAPIRKLVHGFVRLMVKLSTRTQDSDEPEVQDDGPGLGM